MGYCIYKITNIINGKAYIGFTENFEARCRTHKTRAACESYRHKAIHHAIRKYGWEAFTKEILYSSEDGDHTLRVMEPQFIAEHGTLVNNGYNMTSGGEGVPGCEFTAETRQKMSDSHIGEKNAFFGKIHDKVTRQRMKDMARLRPIRYGADAPYFGKVRSEEVRETVRQKVSKTWAITFPDGHTEEIINLKGFCRDHSLVFARMLEIAAGKQKYHKEYSVQRLDDCIPQSKESIELRRQKTGHTFLITFPDGHQETIIGLKGFCKTHGLSPNVLFSVASGKYKQHKGYTCSRVLESSEKSPEDNFAAMISAWKDKCVLVESYDIEDTRLQILKHEWIGKPEIVRSRLQYKFAAAGRRIFARKCVCMEIHSNQASAFLQKYHIQGVGPRPICFGAFYDTELVGVMTFARSRFNKDYEYELVRYAVKFDLVLIGGAGKLFQKFVHGYNPSSVISYSNLRWNTGKVYEAIGMVRKGTSEINYGYVKNGEFGSRQTFQKHKLHKILPNFRSDQTEKENMLTHGYQIVLDAPNAIYVWSREPQIP